MDDTAAWLSDLAARLAAPVAIDPLPLREPIGNILAADMQANFEGSRAPDGTPWPPLLDGSGRKPLIATGALETSAVHMANEATVQALDADTVLVEMDPELLVSYALRQNETREFLGISDAAAERVADLVAEQAIEDLLRGLQ